MIPSNSISGIFTPPISVMGIGNLNIWLRIYCICYLNGLGAVIGIVAGNCDGGVMLALTQVRCVHPYGDGGAVAVAVRRTLDQPRGVIRDAPVEHAAPAVADIEGLRRGQGTVLGRAEVQRRRIQDNVRRLA